jgi:hypothetical protein
MVRRLPRHLAALALSGIVAGLLVAAAPALPALGPGPVTVLARETPIVLDRAQVVTLPFPASDVALHWQGSPDATVSMALAASDGTFGEEIAVGRDEAGEARADTETYGDVIWADGARSVRVRSDRPIARLSVLAFQANGEPTRMVLGGPIVSAATTQPPVITRAGWGADESLRFDAGGHEMWPPSYFPVQQFFVHHTAGRNNDPNPAATIRSIYYYHAITQGWGDIGYNFLIDEAGHIYEGRHARAYASGEVPTSEDLAGNGARGAQAKGFNEGSMGIAMLGTFDSQLPTLAARTSLEQLLAWIAERHGLNPTASHTYTNPVLGTSKWLPTIAGHRDVNQTDCPGAALYAYLPTIRSHVASRIAATTGASVDHTAPIVRSITPLVTNPTGASTVRFGVIFGEPVTGLATADFGVSGTSSVWAVTGLSGKASTYTVTATATAPTAGTLILTLAAGSVTDLGGNTGPAQPVDATATFAVDTSPPSVSVYATPNAAATTATSFVVTVTFSEPVVGLSAAGLVIGGTSNAATPWTVDPVVGSGAHYGFSIHRDSPANGTLTFGVRAGATKDPAGNANVASAVHSVIIDHAAPTTSTPAVRLRSGVTMGSTSVPAFVSWSGTDPGGSGIRSYDLARSVDGATFQVLYSGLVTATAGVNLLPGHAYRFEVRAHDRAGNVGAWVAGATARASVVQQSSGAVIYHGTWTTSTSTSFSGGSARYATVSGASASLTTTARSLAFVTTIASTRGAVRIYVDGTLRATLDLAGTTAFRRVAYATSWSSVGTHTIKIVVVGTAGRPRIDLDAFEVVR